MKVWQRSGAPHDSTLGARVEAERARLFVGREPWLDLWRAALGERPSRPIWHLHGMGGVGKSALLAAWRREARAADVPCLLLDAHGLTPTPDEFARAFEGAACEVGLIEVESVSRMGEPALAQIEHVLEACGQHPGLVALQIDTLELLTPLEDWLRREFAPRLPNNVHLALAGRAPLSWHWRADAGWSALIQSWELPALDAKAEESYLERRGIAERDRRELLTWTRGHALSLCLAADVCSERERSGNATPLALDARSLPELVGPLLRHLLREVPTPRHRAALEAFALVHSMTEELLEWMLEAPHQAAIPSPAPGQIQNPSQDDSQAPPTRETPSEPDATTRESNGATPNGATPNGATPNGANGERGPDAAELFEWLRGLSIATNGRDGLAPHDLAREALMADLRWRHPARHARWHRRARDFYAQRVHRVAPSMQSRVVFDCIFLHRYSPVVAPFFHWRESGCSLGPAREDELEGLLQLVERHEGAASRELARHWLAAQPEGVIVVRDETARARGFLFELALHRATDDEIAADPGARHATRFLERHVRLRSGEGATLFRFWMADDLYQDVGPTQSLLFVAAVLHYLVTPGLAYTLFPCANAEFWRAAFEYADLQRLPEADFEIEGRSYGLYGHDWRARPLLEWLDLLFEREVQAESWAPSSKLLRAAPTAPLDRASFDAAVREALRLRGRAQGLRSNPLMRSALAGRASDHAAREKALCTRLDEAMAALARAPRQERSHRAIELVHGHRALSQEAAAATMHVSHSSLRRYLRAGIEWICDFLWSHEIERLTIAQVAPASDR